MLTCTNNSDPRLKPWLIVVLVILVVVIAAARIPPTFIEYLFAFIVVILFGTSLGLFLYLGPDWSES